jgi:uncharacterized protein (DUF1501 family)
MQRRTFLKQAAAAGLAIGFPLAVSPRRVKAASYDGPCFLFVSAQGGWDPRMLFDPTLATSQNRMYTAIKQVGGFSVGEMALDLARVGLPIGTGVETIVMTPEAFLSAHGSRVLALNGIDTSTNNHDAGQRALGSGRLTAGYPALASLIAGQYGADRPMAFLSGGGYDVTNGVVPLSRITDANAVARIARPNEISPGEATTTYYHTASTMERIRSAQRARLDTQLEEQRLPRLRASLESLRSARETTEQLSALILRDPLASLPGGLGDLQNMQRQVQLALTAFEAGLSVCATVTLGGFDTHGDHDRSQNRQLWKLLGGLDYIVRYAETKRLTDRLVVVVTSEFARGPDYNGTNDGAGKDHWPITSALCWGPGIQGGRVVGATDDKQQPRKLDPGSLTPSDSGITLTPGHLHQELRRIAGLGQSPLAGDYPLTGQPLPLFG